MYDFLVFFFLCLCLDFFSEDGLKLAGKWALGENVHIDHQCLTLKRAVEHMKECNAKKTHQALMDTLQSIFSDTSEDIAVRNAWM